MSHYSKKLLTMSIITRDHKPVVNGKRPNLGSKISTSSVLMRISRDCKEVGKFLF